MSKAYKIKLTSNGNFVGFVDGVFSKDEAIRICTDMEWVFLDVEEIYDMEIVEAS